MKITHTCAACVLLLWAASAGADDKDRILDQKRELETIESDVDDSRRRLDSLQRAQQKVQTQIAEYDQKLSSDQKVIGRLTRELTELQKTVNRCDSQLVAYQQLLERRRRRFLGNIRNLYLAAMNPLVMVSALPNEELELNRRMVYLSALADYESAGVEDASSLLTRSVEQLEELSGKRKTVSGLKQKRETSYALGTSQKQRQQKNLDQLRRKSMAEADRVIMLQQAAKEMAALIARLEEQRTSADQPGAGATGPSVFAGLKGQLSTPYRGRIIVGFGDQADPVTRLKSFSPGIAIEGRPGRSVYSIASGTVAYAGNLRGYGNFVIINHDRQYYTTYAGLGNILVSRDQFVPGRTKLGSSGEDGIVKFELRQGREPLDPVKWIKIESL